MCVNETKITLNAYKLTYPVSVCRTWSLLIHLATLASVDVMC